MTKIPIKTVLSDLWVDLSASQKFIGLVMGFAMVAIVFGSIVDSYRSRQEIKVFENQAIEAKRDAQAALESAAKIAKEKVEQEKRLAETEAKRDGKVREVEAAAIAAVNDRLELERVRRERRGDNPSPEQLCAELAALGYPCH